MNTEVEEKANERLCSSLALVPLNALTVALCNVGEVEPGKVRHPGPRGSWVFKVCQSKGFTVYAHHVDELLHRQQLADPCLVLTLGSRDAGKLKRTMSFCRGSAAALSTSPYDRLGPRIPLKCHPRLGSLSHLAWMAGLQNAGSKSSWKARASASCSDLVGFQANARTTTIRPSQSCSIVGAFESLWGS